MFDLPNILFKKIAPNIDVSDEYLKSVFSGGRFNIHRTNPITHKEIWEGWPKSMKDVFVYYFEKYRLQSYCKTFDYDVSLLR